ncbi:putative uncharacterized protein DDB_G0288537 [Zeugodacus cucurbitae]|uniref:putative uncharacterized protein DDB_G0288537 n=1 Tax=Zeugodacus cucurbitae TaxID=28588 RepID=UPI0023D8EFC9|nr:putative uncharacterized protein DDB_G0288537 [Zeugodacus cucurbitae]
MNNNIMYLRTLYNIATAAAAVVAAASASSNNEINNMHNNININNNNNNNNNASSNTNNNKQRHSSISISNECVQPNELLVAKNRLLTSGLSADVSAAYKPSSATSTPPTQSPAPSGVNKLLCDVLEPEISIRSMYKCCGKRFLQQQQQQQHLQRIQPHGMANAAAAISPPSPATTTINALPTHACATSTSTPSSSSTHHSNCSGCQITAAASIQLANLIGSTMLLPQSAAAAVMCSDVATKAAAAATAGTTTLNVAAIEHKKLHASTNLATEKLVCRGVNASNSALEAASSANASIVSPAASTAKKTNVQFHCEFCTFVCSWKYDLKLHLRQKHGIHNKKM